MALAPSRHSSSHGLLGRRHCGGSRHRDVLGLLVTYLTGVLADGAAAAEGVGAAGWAVAALQGVRVANGLAVAAGVAALEAARRKEIVQDATCKGKGILGVKQVLICNFRLSLGAPLRFRHAKIAPTNEAVGLAHSLLVVTCARFQNGGGGQRQNRSTQGNRFRQLPALSVFVPAGHALLEPHQRASKGTRSPSSRSCSR